MGLMYPNAVAARFHRRAVQRRREAAAYWTAERWQQRQDDLEAQLKDAEPGSIEERRIRNSVIVHGLNRPRA